MENEIPKQPNVDGIEPRTENTGEKIVKPQKGLIENQQEAFQEPVSKDPKKPSKKRLIFLVVILFVLTISGGVSLGIWYYLGQQAKMNKTEAKPVVQKTIPQKNTPTIINGRLQDYIFTSKTKNIPDSNGMFVGEIITVSVHDKRGSLIKEFTTENKLSVGNNKESFDNYQVVGNSLYARHYINQIGGQSTYIGIIKFDNKEKSEIAKFNQGDNLISFIISPDEKYIAWGTAASGDNGVMDLNLSKIDGTLIKKLKTVTGGSTVNMSYLHPFYWSDDSKNIYFMEQGGGRGGYTLFRNTYIDLVSKINIESGSEVIFNSNKDIAYDNIDSSENLYFKKDDKATDSSKIVIKSKVGDLVKEIAIPKYWPNQRAGNFVRNGDEIYFAVAKGDPDNEEFRLIKYDLKIDKAEELAFTKGYSYPEFMFSESNLLVTRMNLLLLFNIKDKTEKKLLEWTDDDGLTVLN